MTRTRLADRRLPDYTKGEERFNMLSHAAGAVFGAAALALCLLRAVRWGDTWDIAGGAVYGAFLVLLYAVSSVYHGLPAGTAKKVMQVIDHCTIFFLIAGSYTPILLAGIRRSYPVTAWIIFSLVWALSVFGVTLTAIDLKRYARFSMCCYIGIGWCIIFVLKPTIQALTCNGFLLLLLGGAAYSAGAVLYGIGKRRRYMHCVFHLFVVLGSVLQFFCIYRYVLPHA